MFYDLFLSSAKLQYLLTSIKMVRLQNAMPFKEKYVVKFNNANEIWKKILKAQIYVKCSILEACYVVPST